MFKIFLKISKVSFHWTIPYRMNECNCVLQKVNIRLCSALIQRQLDWITPMNRIFSSHWNINVRQQIKLTASNQLGDLTDLSAFSPMLFVELNWLSESTSLLKISDSDRTELFVIISWRICMPPVNMIAPFAHMLLSKNCILSSKNLQVLVLAIWYSLHRSSCVTTSHYCYCLILLSHGQSCIRI